MRRDTTLLACNYLRICSTSIVVVVGNWLDAWLHVFFFFFCTRNWKIGIFFLLHSYILVSLYRYFSVSLFTYFSAFVFMHHRFYILLWILFYISMFFYILYFHSSLQYIYVLQYTCTLRYIDILFSKQRWYHKTAQNSSIFLEYFHTEDAKLFNINF